MPNDPEPLSPSSSDRALERQQLTRELLAHPLFRRLATRQDLAVFMQYHVFAVWDFMSLVKRLQRELTGTSLPWMPPRDPLAARLINEIVLAEESDVDGAGGFHSHFDLYLAAMAEAGADTGPIQRLLAAMQAGGDPQHVLATQDLPPPVRAFVGATLRVAMHGSLAEVFGYFFFGREEMIPELFEQLLRDWQLTPAAAPRLHDYLQRHIAVDRDEHGPAARTMMARWLAERDATAAEQLDAAACAALRGRIALWDGVLSALPSGV